MTGMNYPNKRTIAIYIFELFPQETFACLFNYASSLGRFSVPCPSPTSWSHMCLSYPACSTCRLAGVLVRLNVIIINWQVARRPPLLPSTPTPSICSPSHSCSQSELTELAAFRRTFLLWTRIKLCCESFFSAFASRYSCHTLGFSAARAAPVTSATCLPWLPRPALHCLWSGCPSKRPTDRDWRRPLRRLI